MAVKEPVTQGTEAEPEHSYFYHVESPPAGPRVQKFLDAFAAILRHSNYRFVVDLYARTVAKCGRCATACQIYQATGSPKDVPCYRSGLLLDIYRRHFTLNGWLRAKVLNDPGLTEEKLDELAAALYQCTACRRCNLECPLGLDHGLIAHLGRYALSEIGITPKNLHVSAREQLQGASGNTSGVPVPALKDTLEFLEEEIADQKDGAVVKFPIDVEGAEYVFFAPVSDYLMEPDTLMGIAAVLQASGASWTIGTGNFDAINYGLFYNDWVMAKNLRRVVAEIRRLGGKKMLLGECGHASRVAKAFMKTFCEDPVPVVHISEYTLEAIRSGRIQLDPDAVRERVTYHDPCNISRSGWIVEQPRAILRSFVKNFVEMTPRGTRNYCCGGGGGAVSLDEIHDYRMQVGGKRKAEQIKATGAEIVVAPCANCKKQLREIVEAYELPVQVAGLHDLVLRAIRLS